MKYRNPAALLLGLMLSACGSSSTDTPSDDAPADQMTGDTPSDDDPADQTTGDLYPALLAYPGDRSLLVSANRMGSLPEHSRLIGDVNGDGLVDVAQVVRESIDRYSAAVYFTTVSGDLPAFDELDGHNGFVLENVYGNINSPDDNPPWSDGLFDVGDLNGDGYDDIGFQNFHWEVSEWDPDGGFTRGWGYKVLPGAARFDARRSVLTIPSAGLLVELGTTTGELGLGDIDGDGFDDLLIGSRWQTNQILYGSATMNVVLSSEDVERELGDYANVICGGCGIRPLGDFDADGFDDLLLSRRTQECGYSDAVLVVYGRPGGIAAGTLADIEAQQHTRIVNEAGGRCNSSGFLVSSGDVDGDGAADLLQYHNPSYADDRNRASLVFGRVGVRPPAISQDELDGAKGFVMDLGSSLYSDGYQPVDAGELSIEDIDGDGFGDILFPDDTMFRGHVRDVSAVDVPVVVRYAETVTVGWHGYDISSPSAFRIYIDGMMLTDLGGDERSYSFPDPSGGAAFELSLHALDALGGILSTSRRLVPANIGKEQLIGEVQGDRLIELTFNGDGTLEYHSHYLVWRDGVPIGRSLNGADNYVDVTVLPGTTYQYFITPDYLSDGSLDPTTVQQWPLLQRRSNTVELTTPGEKPVDNGTVTPVEPGENLSAAPSDIRLQIYAWQVAELFWTSAEGVLSTAVIRDSEYLGSTEGESYYDATREPDVPHHYALIATAADGSLSPMVVLDTFEEMSVAMLAPDDQSFIGPGPIDYHANTLAVLQEVYGPDSGRQELWLLDRTQAAGLPDPWERVVTFQGDQNELFGDASALAVSGDTVLVGNIIETIDFSDSDTEEPFSLRFEFSVIERDENGNLLEPRLLDFDDQSPPFTSYELYPSVALHGTRALIGGRNDVVYVVERNETGDWQSVQSLASVDGKFLGDAVALFGDTAVAASRGGTELHVFRRNSADMWSEHQTLTGLPDSASASNLLLAMSEDTIALAAEEYTSSDGIQLYRLDSSGTWYPENIVANDAQLNGLALEGDTLLLGLPHEQGLSRNTGTVAVYQRQDSSEWIRKSSLYAADGGAHFGNAVALDDDIGVVLGTGAPPDSSDRVYFFALSAP